MGERELKILGKLLAMFPAIADWIGGLIAGKDVDPDATRRISAILPEVGASERAARELGEVPRG